MRLFDTDYHYLFTFDIAVKREDGYALVETRYLWFGRSYKVELVNGIFYTDSMVDAIMIAHKMGAIVRDKHGVALDIIGVDGLAFRRSLKEAIVKTTFAMLSFIALALLIKDYVHEVF